MELLFEARFILFLLCFTSLIYRCDSKSLDTNNGIAGNGDSNFFDSNNGVPGNGFDPANAAKRINKIDNSRLETKSHNFNTKQTNTLEGAKNSKPPSDPNNKSFPGANDGNDFSKYEGNGSNAGFSDESQHRAAQAGDHSIWDKIVPQFNQSGSNDNSIRDKFPKKNQNVDAGLENKKNGIVDFNKDKHSVPFPKSSSVDKSKAFNDEKKIKQDFKLLGDHGASNNNDGFSNEQPDNMDKSHPEIEKTSDIKKNIGENDFNKDKHSEPLPKSSSGDQSKADHDENKIKQDLKLSDNFGVSNDDDRFSNMAKSRPEIDHPMPKEDEKIDKNKISENDEPSNKEKQKDIKVEVGKNADHPTNGSTPQDFKEAPKKQNITKIEDKIGSVRGADKRTDKNTDSKSGPGDTNKSVGNQSPLKNKGVPNEIESKPKQTGESNSDKDKKPKNNDEEPIREVDAMRIKVDETKQKNQHDNPAPVDENKQSKFIQNENRRQKPLLIEINDYKDEGNSHFFIYFLTVVVLCIMGYLLFHNKKKIIALIVEGRQGYRPRRRSVSKGYRKLENVDDVLSDMNSISSKDMIY